MAKTLPIFGFNRRGLTLQECGTITMPSASISVYGSTHAADFVYPDPHRFQFYFKGVSGGNAYRIWCDWTSSSDYPANNFRVNVDVAPGVDTEIVWMYDHNIGQ